MPVLTGQYSAVVAAVSVFLKKAVSQNISSSMFFWGSQSCALMCPHLILPAFWASQPLHAWTAYSKSHQEINLKIFFPFFCLLGMRGWFLSAWQSNASICTPPSHVHTVCDLLAKSLPTPSHWLPLSCLLYPTLRFSISSHFPHTSSIFHSLCLFLVWQQAAPPCLSLQV